MEAPIRAGEQYQARVSTGYALVEALEPIPGQKQGRPWMVRALTGSLAGQKFSLLSYAFLNPVS